MQSVAVHALKGFSMEKTFITAQQLLEDSFRLASKVYEDGFRPHFIIGIWRGGAPIGIAVQEYFDFKKVETDHIAVRTSSYYGIDQQSKTIKVHGLHYLIENANADDDLLIVDDVFDSGRSVDALIKQIKKLSRANMPKNVRIACPYYKPQNNKTDIVPDYFVHESEEWLVFPHEISGLTPDEIINGKTDLANVRDILV
jgi:hypoxanthine phosphoribosyltransferase|tara:strand:- start:90891 stop:91487 length:597 start_codon:yes stop_codon:yes gene_type:complete